MVDLRVENWTVVEPVSLATLKQHLRVTINTEDTILGTYLTAARESVESYLGRSLINKNFVQYHDYFPGSSHLYVHGTGGFSHHYSRHHAHPLEIKLLRSPMRKVSKIVYTDTSEVIQTLLPKVVRPWDSKVVWYVGDQVLDANGNIQEVTAVAGHDDGSPNLSGATHPSWPVSAGTVTDADITWSYVGVAPAGDFQVFDGEPARLLPLVNTLWPYTLRDVLHAVQIHYVAGYGLNGAYIKSKWTNAILLWAANLYEFREPVSELPLKELPVHLKSLLEQDRIKDYAPTDG